MVHALDSFPYPLKASSCVTIKAAHVAEHIPPEKILAWFDEMWRLLKPGGQMAFASPYANSPGFWNDPTHVTGFTEVAFQLLDPDYPLYNQYEPKPWKIEHSVWKPQGNIEAILKKREGDHYFHLVKESLKKSAMQKPSELYSLYSLVGGMKPKVVLEIGSAFGGVLFGLCRLASSNATIISIDLPNGAFGGQEGIVLNENVAKGYARRGQKMFLIRKNSHDKSTLAELKGVLNGRPVDFLLIDGDHTYKGAKQDYRMYSPLVRKGGAVALHDICDHPYIPECQVKRVWDEVKKGKKHLEFIDKDVHTWGGIGVILP
jgi:predicted O-methyltransferase YrrM